MDRLPEAHIEGFSGPTRKEAYQKVAMLCFLRGEGDSSEDKIAEKAGFGSADAMHHQLKVWGLTGLLLPEEEKQTLNVKAPEADRERKARQGGGEAEDLPPAADASDLFNAAIERLKTDLHYTNHLHEVLQDGRFEATYNFQEELVLSSEYVRDEVSPEIWEQLCAEQGKDPASTDSLTVPDERRRLGGTSPWPTMHLVRLIAAYLITARSGHDVEVLLERLHPKSRKPNIEQINKYLTANEGLLPTIKKLAQEVRGKTVRRGLNVEGEDLFHHVAGDFIRRGREQGFPEEEITRVLREDFVYKLSEDEISRLQEIFSPRPSSE
jgi:hypothetical protein